MSPTRTHARRPGFTLIELMVVIAIILTLIGILTAAVGRFSTAGSVTAATGMLNAIDAGVKAYKTDNKDKLPPSNMTATTAVAGRDVSAFAGGEILVQCLTAPANQATDGLNGNGFRVNNKTFGPYYTPSETGMAASSGTGVNARYKYTMADSPGKKAVLYYRATNATIGTTGNISDVMGSSSKRFMTTHNDALDGSDTPTNHFTSISPGEQTGARASLLAAKYLLMFPGPDDKYGTEDDIVTFGN